MGFCDENSQPPSVNFQIIVDYEKAVLETGLAKGAGIKRDLDSLRSRIQIDNDFNAHVMEIQFLSETELVSKEDIHILKEKVRNILRQWHTPYSILFNCVNCSFSEEAREEFLKVEKLNEFITIHFVFMFRRIFEFFWKFILYFLWFFFFSVNFFPFCD